MKAESSQMAARRSRPRKRRKTESSRPEVLEKETKDAGEQKKTRVVRKKIGKLNDLPSMPIDILFEIFGHLMPYDLLKLSRTTKDFRRLLLNRSSISVWKTSLEQVPGLPPCPSGMSEPAYANLAFSPHCHFCLASYTRNVEWRLRVRICSKCSKSKEYLGDLRDRMSRLYILRNELLVQGVQGSEDLNDRFISLPFEYLIPSRPGKRGANVYLRSDYHALEREYKALGTEEQRNAFIKERKEIVREIVMHAKLCEDWARTQVLDRDAELRQLREERKAAIIQKLEELGWGQDVASIRYPDSLATHKLVDRPQRLTERIWTHIKGGILEYMEEMRVKRIKREFDALVLRRKGVALEVLRAYKNSRSTETEVMPEGPDFCKFEPVKEVLNKPAEFEVNVSSFDIVLPLLPALLAEWRQEINQSMLKLIKSGPTRPRLTFEEYLNSASFWVDEDGEECVELANKANPYASLSEEKLTEKLGLAATAFLCTECSSRKEDYEEYDYWDSDDDSDDDTSNSKLLFYPQVLGHSCLTRTTSSLMFYEFAPRSNDPSTVLANAFRERCPWGNSALILDVHASNIAEEFVKLAGLDPSTATPSEMDQLDLRFGCRLCSEYPRRAEQFACQDDIISLQSSDIPLLKWRAAVKHYKDGHPGLVRDVPKGYIKVEAEQLDEDIKAAENVHRDKVDCIWMCMHCRDTPEERNPRPIADVKVHITTVHEITLPRLDEDYCKHFAHLDIQSTSELFYVQLANGQFSVKNPDFAESAQV